MTAGEGAEDRRRRRADAEENVARILEAATELLASDPDTSIDEIAAAAGVARVTVYRHFSSRQRLVEAVHHRTREASDANQSDALRPPGQLGGAVVLHVADVLNKVPPHLLGEQIVAEAQRLAGVSSVAVYLVDLEGECLLRLAGSAEFPPEIPAPLAVGPEIPREGLLDLAQTIEDQLPGCVVAPLRLRGRAVGALLAVDAPEGALADLAREAAAAIELAGAYTDVFDATRRHRETSAAAEIQQNLLPPRLVRISGGSLAGNVLPGYEIGGDWFDYVENRTGAWIGIGDAHGTGTSAAALSAVALGAFRAKRRIDASLPETIAAMHQTMRETKVADREVRALIGRWHAPSSIFRWISAGDHRPLLIDVDGGLHQLGEESSPALGSAADELDLAPHQARVGPGARLLLLSDGVLHRQGDGGPLGVDGIHRAVNQVPGGSAAATLRAIQHLLYQASEDVLEDDATIVVLAAARGRPRRSPATR